MGDDYTTEMQIYSRDVLSKEEFNDEKNRIENDAKKRNIRLQNYAEEPA